MTTTDAPWSFGAPWGARGHVTDLDGPVHWVEFGERSDLPDVVFVHGLGGSHLNWALVAPSLAQDRRVVALDLHGFGMTPGTRRTSTVHANARLVGRFIDEVVGGPCVLVGNSMGGLVSVLHTVRAPDTVAGIVLVNPALPPDRRRPDIGVAAQFLAYATPGLGELQMKRLRRRLMPEQQVRRIVDLCYADPTRADPEMLARSADLVRARRSMEQVEISFMAAARSMMAMMVKRDAFAAMMRSIDVPVLLVGGEGDRLVPTAATRRTSEDNPTWDAVFLPGVGHTPQLEVPDTFVGVVSDWLAHTPTPIT